MKKEMKKNILEKLGNGKKGERWKKGQKYEEKGRYEGRFRKNTQFY